MLLVILCVFGNVAVKASYCGTLYDTCPAASPCVKCITVKGCLEWEQDPNDVRFCEWTCAGACALGPKYMSIPCAMGCSYICDKVVGEHKCVNYVYEIFCFCEGDLIPESIKDESVLALPVLYKEDDPTFYRSCSTVPEV